MATNLEMCEGYRKFKCKNNGTGGKRKIVKSLANVAKLNSGFILTDEQQKVRLSLAANLGLSERKSKYKCGGKSKILNVWRVWPKLTMWEL